MKIKILNKETNITKEQVGVFLVKAVVSLSVGTAIDAIMSQNISYDDMSKSKGMAASLGIWIASAVIADEITDKFLEQIFKKVEKDEKSKWDIHKINNEGANEQKPGRP